MFPHKLPYAIVKRKPIRTNVTMIMTCFCDYKSQREFFWANDVMYRVLWCLLSFVPYQFSISENIGCWQPWTGLRDNNHGLRKNLSTPEKSETYDVLVTSPDALPLSYRILEGFKAIRQQWWTKVLLRHFCEMTPLTQFRPFKFPRIRLDLW